MKNSKLRFQVPVKKMYRMIVDTDAKNEADDQFAIAHHLMTPMFDVKGIIATHFEHRADSAFNSRKTMQASYDEIQLVLKLMGLTEEYPVYRGCVQPLEDETHFVESEGARFIVEEAMKDDEVEIPVQINGKTKAVICISVEISKEDAIAKAKEALGDKLNGTIIKEIYVPKKIVNIVAK